VDPGLIASINRLPYTLIFCIQLWLILCIRHASAINILIFASLLDINTTGFLFPTIPGQFAFYNSISPQRTVTGFMKEREIYRHLHLLLFNTLISILFRSHARKIKRIIDTKFLTAPVSHFALLHNRYCLRNDVIFLRR
jgi:hypothetical protein